MEPDTLTTFDLVAHLARANCLVVVPEDVTELAAVQRNLLERVANSVKPGGKLIYSVCTLSNPETIETADHFTRIHPEFEPLSVPDSLANAVESDQPGQYWAWPQKLGGNGMFIAGWRKKG